MSCQGHKRCNRVLSGAQCRLFGLHPVLSFNPNLFLRKSTYHDPQHQTTTPHQVMRPLTLHASALTDSEYDLYTNALLDLAGEDVAEHPSDDSYYASLVVSAREARAWIRGRYTASSPGSSTLTPNTVDAVLKLFCPNLAPADTMSGGQFFAAMRLVTHLRHGKLLDGSLVFVQGKSRAPLVIFYLFFGLRFSHFCAISSTILLVARFYWRTHVTPKFSRHGPHAAQSDARPAYLGAAQYTPLSTEPCRVFGAEMLTYSPAVKRILSVILSIR